MLPNRVRIPKGTTELLKLIKARTGVTPNILARFALALSIEDARDMGVQPTDTAGSEFNLPTLFGEFEKHYEALLRQRYGELSEGDCGSLIAAHIERGAQALRRLKSPGDLLELL